MMLSWEKKSKLRPVLLCRTINLFPANLAIIGFIVARDDFLGMHV
jgi:hypothetical protein